MTVPGFNPKRIKAVKRILKYAGTAIERTVTGPGGLQTLARAGGKGQRAWKKHGWFTAKGLGEGLKAFGEGAASGFARLATAAAPKKTLLELHAEHIAKFEKNYGARTAEEVAKGLPGKNWTKLAKKTFQGTLEKFQRGKVEDVDFRATPEQVLRRHAIAKRISLGLMGTAGAAGIAGYFSDKAKIQGMIERPSGARFETHLHSMSLTNPEGGGSRVDAGVKYKHPSGHGAEVGGAFGFGRSHKAGIAHQLSGYAKANTPYGKTAWEVGEQHAFGTKSRSRRVAAIRRAVFHQEQHLGIDKKPSRKFKRSDSLV